MAVGRLSGKVAIITGAGSGIGRAIALAYAKEGAKVVAFGRTKSRIEETAAEIAALGQSALAVAGDVTRGADVKSAVEAALRRFGGVDILVNNAGVTGPSVRIEGVEESEWDETMNTNVKGLFLFTKAVLPQMIKEKRGNIINVSSRAGVRRERKALRSVPYTVSKFAVEGFTYGVSVQLKGTGINVNSLVPRYTRTGFQEHLSPEALRLYSEESGTPLEPESVVPVAVYLAALSPGELTGESVSVDSKIPREPSS